MYGSFCAFSACSSASRPFCSVSSRVSRENHWRILLRARDDAASESQSRDGPRPRLGREDLDEVAALQLVVEGHDAAVDLGADRAVPDVRVHGVREVDRRRAGRQRLHVALGREHVDLVREEVRVERLDELARIGLVRLPVDELAHPRRPLLVALAALALLVDPVRGDAELGLPVHLARPDLDLERLPLGPDHRRVQRPVAVELRHGDEVLEAAGHRLPERVDEPEGAVAVARALLAGALGDDPHRREVVDLVELAALAHHLVVDRIGVLRAAGDVGGDVRLLELALEDARSRLHVLLAVASALGHHRLDLRVLPRVEPLEREVLELPLDRVDAEPVRDRRIDVERLLRLLELLLPAEVLDRPHVVEAVGELDEDDARVLRHRDDHLAVVLDLRVLAARELDASQLRDTLDEPRDLVPELVLDVRDVAARVLDDIVEQRCRQRLLVEMERREDLRGAPRVPDEVLTGAAALPIVSPFCERECPAQQVLVDVRLVRGDVSDQLLDEVLVPFLGLDDGHVPSVDGGPNRGLMAKSSVSERSERELHE